RQALPLPGGARAPRELSPSRMFPMPDPENWPQRMRRLVFPQDETALEKRLLRVIALLGGVVSLGVVLPVNLAEGLPWTAHVGAAAFGLTCLGTFQAARHGRYLVRTLFFSCIALLDVVWLAN